MAAPALFSFDIFGTVVDWRRGLREALAARGRPLSDAEFDRVIDAQGQDEQQAFRPYREITARSLVAVLGLEGAEADAIGAEVGRFPLYPDAREGLRRLLARAPCVALTNSDRAHGEGIQEQLGFRLSHWISAEELGLYKPAVGFWEAAAARLGLLPGPSWWHVSAYGDYDLDVAARLGLLGVFVERPHARPGPAVHRVRDLGELAALAERP